MGSGEESTPVKPSKPANGTQEVPSTPSYPDWTTPMQAYYGIGATPPPAFFTSTVASSPSPHPYLWGSQHLIPPYGSPLPYPAIYSHAGIYAHPSMTTGTVATASETEARSVDEKDRRSTKKSMGSSGNISCGKSVEGGKATTSANDDVSQSGESGTEGYSDSSNDSDKNEFRTVKKRSFDQMLADGASAQQNNAGPSVDSSFNTRGKLVTNRPVSLPGKSAGTMPGTNLNIGMDLWNSSPACVVSMKERPAVGVAPGIVPAAMVGRDGVPSDLWIQDERELKRQRRKQSNRESARRSRLRKQAECEELAAKVETLNNENRTLRNELQRLADECKKLTAENASIMEELNELYGHGLTKADGDETKSMVIQAVNGEGNGYVHENSRGSNSVSARQYGKYFSSNEKLESGRN